MLSGPAGEISSESGFSPNTTNNRMELTAAIEGLRKTSDSAMVEVFTDSSYLQNGCERWMKGWKKAGWMRNGKEIPNADLWRELDLLTSRRRAVFTHVSGHSGQMHNEMCDRLARQAIERGRTKGVPRDKLSPNAERIVKFLFSMGIEDKNEMARILAEAKEFLLG